MDWFGQHQNLGGGGSHPRYQVWAIDAGGWGSGNRHCSDLFFQQTAEVGARVGGLDEHQLRGLPTRPMVDGLEEAL